MISLTARAAIGLPLAAALLALALGACDSADSAPPPAAETEDDAPLGAPPSGMPDTLSELLEHSGGAATSWQAEPKVSELFIDFGDDGAWEAAHVTYLAGGADRLLLVSVTPDGVRQERPTLETLGLQPVSPDGLAQVPDLPEGTAEPAALVAAAEPVLRGCGLAAQVSGVLYATGAPVSWDPDAQSWSSAPEWRATVSVELPGGLAGAVLDPVTGEPIGEGCIGGS